MSSEEIKKLLDFSSIGETETTGAQIGGGMGSWLRPGAEELSRLEDGQVVAINKGGVVRQAKYDAKSGTFRYEDEWTKGKGEIVNKIPGATQDPDNPSYLRLNWSPFDAGLFKAGGNMVVKPDSLDAFGIGESALKTAGKEAVRAAVPSTVGLGAFMLAQARTPGPPIAKLASGVVSSALASGGATWLQDQTGLIGQTDQDVINQTINPTSAKLGAFAPTLIAFRPSYGVLRAAAGLGGNVERDVALNTIKTGGLMNMGIAQGGAMVDPIIHGSPDPSINRFQASARTIGFGDPSQPYGGGLMGRAGHAATEFGIGGLLLHKPWGVGAGLHNLAHGKEGQVKIFSGAPTEEALLTQRLNAEAAILARVAEQKQKVMETLERDAGTPVQASPETRAGLDQIRSILAESLAKKRIDQATHDEAVRISETFGEEMLKNIQLRQVGGYGERDTVEGQASRKILSNDKGVVTAVEVFAKALNEGKFTSTLSHEMLHPLYESLSPRVREGIIKDLIRERANARKATPALDSLLKQLNVKNEGDWMPLADRVFTRGELETIFQKMKSEGIVSDIGELVHGKNGIFSEVGKLGGFFKLKNEFDSGNGKISRRLWEAREFFTVEGSRIIKARGKYDKDWGITDGDTVGFFRAIYNTIKRSVMRSHAKIQTLLGTRESVDAIIDRITEKKIKEITASGSEEISGLAMDPVNVREVSEQDGQKPVSIGDILETGPKNESPVEARARAIRDLAEPRLSEGDAEPSLPKSSKDALKELGIKDTVINNVVRHSAIGTIRTEFGKASTAGEVAHIFRNTSQATQESIQVLVTDKDGNPLEIYRHTLSEPGASTLASHVMISQALSVKGAKKVWISHNHPSMTPSFSPSDLMTESNIKDMFKGTGLRLEGFLAIAGESYAFIGRESMGQELERQAIPGSRFPTSGKEVPIIERRFTLPRGEGNDHLSQRKATTDTDQRMLVDELLKGKTGVIFLDRNDMAVGQQAITAEKMGKLGVSGVRNLLGAYSRSGAQTMLIHVGDVTVPELARENAATNLANMGASVKGGSKAPFIKAIIATDNSAQTRFPVEGNRRAGFKSEGDESSQWRGEAETRSGVGAIKPLHAAPGSNFPIMAEKLKDFGFERGYLNQFSEHAVVGELKTGVTQVRTAGDVASLMHDYSSTLAQGQTMILIVGADGKPIQVGLHMVDSSMNAADNVVIKPMWGVLAGQAVSTPGAKEAWMVRVNNDIVPGEVDGSIQNELALKNLLEGSGINYRGMVSVSGSKYRSIEYKPGVQNPNGGANQFDSTNVDWMPIDKRPATSTIPLTERRYTTRSQIPYDTGVTASDRPIGSEDAKWNRSENESAKRLREHLGGEPGVVFKTSSGKIVGTVTMTIEEMANIRNSPAQKTLLAMMDRAGVNWGMVSIGDAPNTPEAARATSNINAFLKQMGLKVTDTFQNDLGIVPGDPVGTSEYRWQSEGDAEVPLHRRDLRKDTPEWRQSEQDVRGLTGVSSDEGDMGAYGRRVPTPLDKFENDLKANKGSFTDQEKGAFQLQSNNLIMKDGVTIGHILRARPGNGGKITDHRADFENFGIPLGDNINEQNKNLKDVLNQAFDGRIGVARTGEGFGYGIRTAQYEGSLDTYVTVLGKYRGKIIQMVFETTPTGNELRTAFPISLKSSLEIQNHPTFLSLDNVRYRESRGIARSQSKAGAENPNKAIIGSAGRRTVEPAKPNLIDQTTKVQGTYGKEQAERRRGMLNNTVFSEGDAQDFSGRAEEAFKRDQIVGPEAIKGDFLAWAKSMKELANEHLFQAPYPLQFKDGADRERDQQRLQSHRVIDQLIAKLERQKGFNPMTLKPGFLDAVRKVSTEAMMISFKELAREAVNVHDATGLDPEAGGFIPASENLDAPNAERDRTHKQNLDWHWKKVQEYHSQFIKHVRLSMDSGMIAQRTGLEVIDMANEIRSRTFNRADGYGDMRGWGRMSEGDAENMRIPGGARDEAMKRRPARTNKTYLQIGHGAGYGDPGAQASNRPYFDPENTYLYHFDSKGGKFAVRKISDIADAEGIDLADVKADSFVHGDQGELGIDTGIGIKRGESGVNGRIELDHKRQTIFVSAGSSRGDLNNFRAGELGKMRAEALAQVRKYVKNMQDKGHLPKGYKIEGYGYDMNRSSWEPQERFSEGDAEPQARSFRQANHKDAQLLKNGFITNYADKNWIRGLQRNDAVVEVREMGNSRTRIFEPSMLNDGKRRDFKLEILDRVTGREIGHIYFDMMNDHTAYVVSTSVKERMENRGVAKIMYAELGERLRRAGVTDLTGMVIDEIVDKKTGEVIHRPIAAREAVFGLGSTEAEHVYGNNDHYTQEDMDEGRVPKDEQVWNHATVRTEIDPKRRLSEGDEYREDPALPPDTNPRTKGGEIANHTNAQLAKRGFISNYAESKLKSLAGMKVSIGLQDKGANFPLTPITGDMKIDLGRTHNTFHGVVEYTGENGMVEAAQFTYVVENYWSKGARQGVPSETGAKLDWIKIKPQFRGRDLSNVITAEVVERLKRLRQDQVDLFVVDPAGRPIHSINRILGPENVETSFNGEEPTDSRDQFRYENPASETGFSRKTWDVTGHIDPKKLYSEGDGENMRIPGGARDEFQRRAAGVRRPKPIKFWTDVGHADIRDAEGEQNTYLWYATKKGEIQVISADELRTTQTPEGYQLIDSDDIPTHHDWETHLDLGNIQGDFGKQPITDLPHGRIDDRGDVTRISYMDHHRSRQTDYEFLRDEIKQKLADFMNKKADEMPGYDFTRTAERGTDPERFSEGDADQNYEGLAFSENDVRKYIYGKPEERREIFGSLPDKKNRDEFRIMSEYIRNKDFEDRPRIREIRAKQEARRQEIIEKHRAQGHPHPELAADQEMNPPPTGPDPEAELDQMRRSRRSDRGNMNSEGDAENMRIPGGARDQALKKRESMLRQKRFRKADFDLLYTDIGHGDDFGVSDKMETVKSSKNQFLWSYDRYGQFHVQSLREALDTYNEQRMRKYEKLLGEGAKEEDISDLTVPLTEAEFTHTEWAKSLGLRGPQDLDYKTGNGRMDVTVDGDVRMSWVAKIPDIAERQMMAEQIKEEAAAWLNSNKDELIRAGQSNLTKSRRIEPGKIQGWNWGYGSEESTGRPRRFSEGDAENGRWPNQERAKGKIPNVRISNGETDLGFVLEPGEMLDSKGLRIRNNSKGRMTWGDIGHDPEYFVNDEAVIEAMETGWVLPGNFDSASGLFAYNTKTGRVETTQDRLFTSHLDWLSPNSNFGDPSFGKVPDNYTMMGRFEPAIIGTDGKIIRRGRISLARNTAEGNWVFDLADFSRSDIPPGALAKIKEAVAEEANAILDEKNRAKFRLEQETAADHYDTYGFGMAKDKADMGFSPKDTGPLKLDEDAKTYRDLAERPIGEGKDGQARLKKIAGKLLSEGDAVEETPFTIPKNAGNRTNMELARDIVRARFFTGISQKAHDNAAEFPLSKTMKRIADMIHARAGAEAGVTGLDLPTSIMKERTKHMNRFFDIMDPLRSEFASMDRATREQAYQDMADMVTGLKALDTSTPAGRAAQGLKDLLRDLHDYRTAAGEKLGEVEDYFPAVYDSVNISENAMAFKEDAKRAYMIELKDQFQGEELEAAAEKAARELTMSHIRGENAGSFNDLFGSEAPAMGENSSMKRKFGPESQQIMSKWQIKDPYRIIARYIAGATKSAELVRRLGNEGQEWRKMAQALESEGVSYEKIDEMRDLLKAAVGVGLRQNTRAEQTFIDLMGLYTAGSVMGRSFLNNMFEPASMGVRSGNLALGLQAYGETWARAIRNAARILSGERIDKTFWEQYAEHIGTMSADINDAWMNSHSIEVDADRSDPRISWLTSKVYQSNLLQMTENAKLQASHAIGFKYLVNLAEMQQGKSFMNKLDVTESVKSSLRELGIKDADHAAFAQWMMRLSAMDDAGRMRALTSGGKMSKLFEQAITKFSMQASVRANRAHKPVFQDGPIGKTLFQLMSYSYAYAAEVNSRTYSYARSALKSAPAGKSYTVGDRIRFMAPLMMVPMGIVAFRAMFALKDEMYPTEYSEKHKNDPWYTKWLNASSFAGVFGPKVEMATKYVMRDQPPGGPAGQLAVGAARAAKTAVLNAIEGKPQDNAQRQAARAAVPAIKAGAVIGATAVHPAAGTIASQLANSTSWSNAMTAPDKKETDKKEKPKRY